jgi:hypothetical protein
MDHGARLCFFAVTPTRVCLFSVFSFQFSVFGFQSSCRHLACRHLASRRLVAPGSWLQNSVCRLPSPVYRLPSPVFRVLSPEF